MRIATFASIAALSMIMAASPLTTTGLDLAAMAKAGGNGGGQSGSQENRGNAKATSLIAKNVPAEPKQNNLASELAGLNALNRSYKDYMHTSDRT